MVANHIPRRDLHHNPHRRRGPGLVLFKHVQDPRDAWPELHKHHGEAYSAAAITWSTIKESLHSLLACGVAVDVGLDLLTRCILGADSMLEDDLAVFNDNVGNESAPKW